jgi:hypothetical protein
MNINDFRSGMRKHFGIPNPDYYLAKHLLPYKIVSLDILKFDDEFLIPRFGDYTAEQGKSLSSIVSENFGMPAENFVRDSIRHDS